MIEKFFHKEGYVVAYVTSLLYVITFVSELGRALSFDFPPSYIDMGATLLSVSAANIFTMVLVSYAIFKSTMMILKSKSGLLKWIFWLALAFCPAYMFVIISSSLRFSYPYKGAVIVAYLTFYVIVYFRGRILETLTSLHFLERYIEHVRSVWIYMFTQKGFFIVNVIFISIIFYASYSFHNKNNEVPVFHKIDDYAVVAQYGDKIIAKKLINHKLSHGYYIFKVDSLESIEIENKKIIR